MTVVWATELPAAIIVPKMTALQAARFSDMMPLQEPDRLLVVANFARSGKNFNHKAKRF
jgi:hypothetical protein